MYIKCVACLTTIDTEHFLLSAVLPEYFETNLTVLELLEFVTSTTVRKYISPNSICSTCLKQLKECYFFIREFKISQQWLEENLTQEMREDQSLDTEYDEIGKDNLEEIILQVECKEEPELDTNVKNGDTSKVVADTQLHKQIVREHPYPIIASKKFREIKPKGVILMSYTDILNSTPVPKKKMSRTAKIKKDELKHEKPIELSPNSIVMSVIDVLNSKSQRKIAARAKAKNSKIKSEKVKGENKEKVEGGEEPAVCDLCNNIYPNQKSLKNHKRRIHVSDSKDKEKLRCNVCGLQCRTRSSLNYHSGKHKGDQIKCDDCDKVCSTVGQLKYHKMVAHGPEDFLCNHCGERFNYARALTFHEVTVHQIGDKPFMCRFCGFRCLQRGHLKRHERCHTDERPFKCKYKFCNKTFRGKSEMHSHHRVHEGNKTLECKYCGKMFFRLWNMKLHWLQHAGNHKCTICAKGFVEEDVLNFHYFHNHKIRIQVDGKEGSENLEENDESGDMGGNDQSEYVEGNVESEYLQDNLHEHLDLNYIMQSEKDVSDL